MNYNERGVILRQQELKSGSKKIAIKGAVIAFRVVLLALVVVVFLGAFVAFGALRGLVSSSPSLVNLDLAPNTYKTTVYYANGEVSKTLYESGANRSYAYIESIPQIIRYAFIAKEDTRFYSHKGIDVQGIFRALVSDLKTRSFGYGGSTITQQLLKNQVFGGGEEKNVLTKITRKVQEQFLAIQAENMYTKDQILEFYINCINFGNGNYGIQEAAQGYFGKGAESLTLSEACVLAPIAYSPTYRNPVTHPDENAKKRLELLDAMLEGGFCTQEQYDEALSDDVYTRIAEYQENTVKPSKTPTTYFMDALIDQLISDLVTRLGVSEAEASKMIYSGGLEIYTTQDPVIQGILDKYYLDPANFPEIGNGSFYEITTCDISVLDEDGKAFTDENGKAISHMHWEDFRDYFAQTPDTSHNYYPDVNTDNVYYRRYTRWMGVNRLCLHLDDFYAKLEEFRDYLSEKFGVSKEKFNENIVITPQPQSSMTIIEQSTGRVVALYGGRGQKTASRTFNRALSLRSVGSTFKVLASFLPALDGGGLTLASVVNDSQFIYPGSSKEVTNWWGAQYRGLTTMRQACYDSMNVCAVKFLAEIGATLSFNYLKKLGFTTLVTSRTEKDGTIISDINLAIALGGLSDGVSNLELTAAFATIANNGCYQSPILYTEVYDHDGNLILSNSSKSTQVIKPSTAWLLTSAMEDVVNIGTGGNLHFRNYPMHIAGKTGTSTKTYDLWFAGFSPYYTAAIWTGFDQKYTQTNTSYQQHIWRNVMEEIHKTLNLPDKAFEMPDSIVTAEICTKCGKLAVHGLCDEYQGGNCIKTEYFAKGTVPTEWCDCHVKVRLCNDSGHIASPECPTDSTTEVVLLKLTDAQMQEMIYRNPADIQRALDRGEVYKLPELKEGEEPTYVVTWDTPFMITNEKAKPCPIHNPSAYDDDGGKTFDVPDDDDIGHDDNKDDTHQD